MNKVIFCDKKLEKDFEALKLGKFEDMQLHKWIFSAIQNLKIGSSGIKVPKRLWPTEYIKNYEITNLWKYNMPEGWRLTYTIKTTEIAVFYIILEWFNHKEYERRFGY